MEEIVSKKFKAKDGKTFETEAECLGHEKYLEEAPVIESFITSINTGKAQAGALRRLLPQFVHFYSTYVPPQATGDAPAA